MGNFWNLQTSVIRNIIVAHLALRTNACTYCVVNTRGSVELVGQKIVPSGAAGSALPQQRGRTNFIRISLEMQPDFLFVAVRVLLLLLHFLPPFRPFTNWHGMHCPFVCCCPHKSSLGVYFGNRVNIPLKYHIHWQGLATSFLDSQRQFLSSVVR